MNLYYAITNYHLLCCVLHSLKYHRNETNVLYLSCWHPDYELLLHNLNNSNLFSDVKVFSEVVFPSGNKKISSNQIRKDINYLVKHIPADFISDVKKSNEIYIAGDDYCCSVYLIENKIHYNYIEEACGVLSDEQRLMNNIRKIDFSRFQIMKKLKLPGNHSFIVKRFGDLNHQLSGYFNEKDIHFSVDECLKELSSGQISKIVNVFSDEKFKVPNCATLLLTFHYVNMNLLSMSEQRLLYYFLIDYFCNDENLVIKQHPSDFQPNYHEWFPNALILPRRLPSELLPFLSASKYSKIVTAYSTSIFSMQSYCSRIISFNSTIEQSFKKMHKYYFLVCILKKLKLRNYEIFCLGMNESIIKNFLEQFKIPNLEISFLDTIDDLKLKHNKIVIIDEFKNFDYSIISDNDIFISLDSENDYNNICCYEQWMEEYFSFAFLKKDFLDETKYCNFEYIEPEMLMFYCTNKAILAKIKSIKIVKELKNMNIKVKLIFDYFDMYICQVRNFKKLVINYNFINKNIVDIQKMNDNLNQTVLDLNDKYNCLSNSSKEMIDYYKKLYNDVVNSSSWRLTKIYRKFGYVVKKILGRRL